MDTVITVLIDRAKDEPAYEQIASQIRTCIVTGAVLPGTALPGVRTLAADLGVNLNTVARAYRLLADEGFVRIRDRSGVVVAAPAHAPAPHLSAGFRAELEGLLARMRQAGVSAEAIRRMVDDQLDEMSRLRTESEN